MMTELKYVGMHADTVHDGDKSIPVGPGDVVNVPTDENKNMVDEGLLIPVVGSPFKEVENG